MDMKRLSALDVHARKVVELGLDPDTVDLTSSETIACALRRVSGFLCPCARASLIRGVVQPLRGLVGDLKAIKKVVESMLEGLIAHGDLLEHRDVEVRSGNDGVVVYAAPPSFVLRESGIAILLGIASDQLSALPDELEKRIEYITHVRRLVPLPGENLHLELVQLGLIELPYTRWLKAPSMETPANYILKLSRLLESAPSSIEIPGLSLLDPTTSVRYYPGRWVEPKNHTGKFIGRRTQAYGADLWCYVEMSKGRPVKFLDFPIKMSRWRGCDEAWRLQAAIDYEHGSPQMYRVRPGPSNTFVINFFAPVPMWARRRWDAVGEPIESSEGLFSYKFGADEIKEELRFLKNELWLTKIE